MSQATRLDLAVSRLQQAMWLGRGLGPKRLRNIRRTLGSVMSRLDIAVPAMMRDGGAGAVNFARRERAWLVHSSVGLTYCDQLREKVTAKIATVEDREESSRSWSAGPTLRARKPGRKRNLVERGGLQPPPEPHVLTLRLESQR